MDHVPQLAASMISVTCDASLLGAEQFIFHDMRFGLIFLEGSHEAAAKISVHIRLIGVAPSLFVFLRSACEPVR
jgi:hypothetical protein